MAAPARAEGDDRERDRIEQARARALTSAYQPELPRDRPLAGAAPQTTRSEPARDRPEDTRAHRRAEDPAALGSVVRVLLWGLVVVVLGLFAIWLGRELLPRGDGAALPPDAP